jgi:hypothetical protein
MPRQTAACRCQCCQSASRPVARRRPRVAARREGEQQTAVTDEGENAARCSDGGIVEIRIVAWQKEVGHFVAR